jgi:hypothetical protein
MGSDNSTEQMIKKFLSTLLIGMLLFSCKEKPFHQLNAANTDFIPNTVFASAEDLSSPKFAALREKYQLDTIFHGEQDEFKRILLLRNWIREKIMISDFEDSYPGDSYAEGILDAALKGHGFHCGHYMIVQNAVMNAYGYVTRCLGAGPGVKGGPDGHHGMNEIWLNKYKKWFLSDAKYNHHFEKNGIPLSALEIRAEYLKNKAADVELVKGPEKIPITGDKVANKKGEMVEWTKERFAQTYTWLEWESFSNRFTDWPKNSHNLSKMNMLADGYFKDHMWIWDGKPHWAYNTEFMKLVADRKSIEWTPNVIASTVYITGNTATIKLKSNTPNLETYQVKELPDVVWKNIPDSVEIKLVREKNEFVFRTLNLAKVSGPEHKIIISN